MNAVKIYLTAVLLLACSAGIAQTGSVKGTVTTKNGTPAEAITIWLKDTRYTTIADKNGDYLITDILEGNYVLLASLTGVRTLTKKISIRKGETLILDLSLTEDATELKEVTVTASRTLNEHAATVGKAGIQLKDLPQSITIINRDIMEKQQVQLLSDVLKNVNGVYVMGTSGGTQEEIAGRGYAFSSSNTFKNGVRYNNSVLPEMSSLERVEVLKGSNAILYGNVAAGGVLNLVTRKPKFEKGGEMSIRAGSNDFYKTSLDSYGAVNNNNQLAYRVSTSYEKGNSFRDNIHSERFYINSSFLYKLSEKTTFLLETDYLSDTRTSDYGTGAINYKIAPLPRNRFLGALWSYNKAEQKTFTLTTTHKLNTNWELKNITNYSGYTADLFGTTRPNASGNFIQANGRWIRGVQRSQVDEKYFITQFDLTGKFMTGSVKHQLLLGADADKYLTNTTAFNNLAVYDTINVFDPGKYKQRNDIPDLSKNTLTKAPVSRIGVYIQDLISLTGQLKVLAGIRYTQQQTRSDVYYYGKDSLTASARNDHAFTPRTGIVYQPAKNISFFISYANSFTLNTGIDTTGNPLAPSYLNQYEAGIKTDLFKRFLSANLTVYRIVNSNLSQSLLPANPRYPTAQELAGEVTSKGIELDILTKSYHGFSLLAGYSFNDTRYTKSNTYITGSKLRYNPQHTANASLFYTCTDRSSLRGLNMGITAFYTGERVAGRSTRVTVANDSYQLMPVPEFTQVDLSLGYTKQSLSFRVKMSNSFNVLSYYVHDDNSVNPIAPRQFSASVACRL